MRWKNRLIILVCVVAASGLLIAAWRMQPKIHQKRSEMGLVLNDPLENAPPSLAFATVAMGAFRGLVVDVLWIRADRLKQEGKFFDAKQLAEWITILQPRFAKVWDFHAWNMAYNISVAIPNTQCAQRWQWVRNGYELLRDRGIPLNPQDISLYRSLGWIFWHKIGDNLDDCHRYYKMQLLMEMRPLLGEQTNEEFERLAAAPKNLSEILADPDVAPLIESLSKADSRFQKTETLVDNFLALRRQPGQFPRAAFEVIDSFRDKPGLAKFDTFARAWVLRNTWKMDPELMVQINRQYGRTSIDDPNEQLPINWEHPAAHAIYWAVLGLRKASRPEQYRIDEKNTDRIVFHSLQQLYRSGNLILYTGPEGETALFIRPDPKMFTACDQIWRTIIEKYEKLEKGNPKAVRGGHKNFLENALMSMYQAGHERRARQIYQEVRKLYPRDDAGQIREEYLKPFEEFVQWHFRQEMEGLGFDDATEAILFRLQEAYFYYAIREDDEASAREKLAQQIYDYYMEELGKEASQRLGLPPMDLIRYTAFRGFMEDPEYPPSFKMSLLGRIQIERPDLFEKLQQQEQWFLEQIRQYQQPQSTP
ncbi:MAG TPA: hypothetical protein PKY88_04590 [Anaerohalosphaeraceae bacterium]|nr:hypothetical protein [Anaerohalosphaeraceae bacterium]